MNKSLFFLVIISIYCSATYPQNKFSVEGSAGIISPINSSAGISGSAQLNYSLNDALKLFCNASYSVWNKYNVFYEYEFFTSKNPVHHPIKTFSADDHSLVSVNLGSRFLIHENKVINLLLDTQIGLSFFSFNEYVLNEFENPETGQIDLKPDINSPLSVNETLLSFGFGPIFERKINSAISLFLSMKLNTMLNAGNTQFISKRGTYFLVSAGFTHSI